MVHAQAKLDRPGDLLQLEDLAWGLCLAAM
jgi:hypothetical protein